MFSTILDKPNQTNATGNGQWKPKTMNVEEVDKL